MKEGTKISTNSKTKNEMRKLLAGQMGASLDTFPLSQENKEAIVLDTNSPTEQEIIKSREQENKRADETSSQENNKARKQEIKRTRHQEKPTTIRKRRSRAGDIPLDEQENKKSRVVYDIDGTTRRPANLTLVDELRIAINVLAAKRQIRPWVLINEAIRTYLINEGEIKE